MNDTSSFEKKRTQIFTKLLDTSWNDKKIWEHIRDGYLSATPAFEGNLYHDPSTTKKIMFVGRDLNGWDEPLGDCSTLENTVKAIVEQTGALETFVIKEGVGDKGKKYYHKHSKFLRFIKHVLEQLGESEPDIECTFYDDAKQWNQRFVWANLYCISPRNPNSSEDAHPDNAMVKLGIEEYVDLIELYVKYYEPDVVIFITDVYGWFVRWSRLKSFKDIVDNYQEHLDGTSIVATGNIGKSNVIVCKRPDKRGMSYQAVEEMANAVSIKILNFS